MPATHRAREWEACSSVECKARNEPTCGAENSLRRFASTSCRSPTLTALSQTATLSCVVTWPTTISSPTNSTCGNTQCGQGQTTLPTCSGTGRDHAQRSVQLPTSFEIKRCTNDATDTCRCTTTSLVKPTQWRMIAHASGTSIPHNYYAILILITHRKRHGKYAP